MRTALVNRLRASGAPLVTVTAPAGYGKTTLLAQWEARDERPFAWVRLDDDTDPRVLVRNLAVRHGSVVAFEYLEHGNTRSRCPKAASPQ